MRTYQLSIPDDAPRLQVSDESQFAVVRQLGKGEPWTKPWPAVSACRMQLRGVARRAAMPDYTYISNSGIPVVNAKLRSLLEPLLKNCTQWLPVQFEEGEYCFMHPIAQNGLLDIDRCLKQKTSESAPPIIEGYAFLSERLKTLYVFRAMESAQSVLATEAAKQLFQREGITGGYFKPIWDEDVDPFRVHPFRGDILTRPEVFGPDGFVGGFEDAWPDEWREQAGLPERRRRK